MMKDRKAGVDAPVEAVQAVAHKVVQVVVLQVVPVAHKAAQVEAKVQDTVMKMNQGTGAISTEVELWMKMKMMTVDTAAVHHVEVTTRTMTMVRHQAVADAVARKVVMSGAINMDMVRPVATMNVAKDGVAVANRARVAAAAMRKTTRTTTIAAAEEAKTMKRITMTMTNKKL